MNQPESFDLRVHHRDPKTGKILRSNDYVMKVSKEGGTRFIRDGVEYHPNGRRVQAEQVVDTPPVSAEEAKKPAETHKGNKK